jgi:hypothetical protein
MYRDLADLQPIRLTPSNPPKEETGVVTTMTGGGEVEVVLVGAGLVTEYTETATEIETETETEKEKEKGTGTGTAKGVVTGTETPTEVGKTGTVIETAIGTMTEIADANVSSKTTIHPRQEIKKDDPKRRNLMTGTNHPPWDMALHHLQKTLLKADLKVVVLLTDSTIDLEDTPTIPVMNSMTGPDIAGTKVLLKKNASTLNGVHPPFGT